MTYNSIEYRVGMVFQRKNTSFQLLLCSHTSTFLHFLAVRAALVEMFECSYESSLLYRWDTKTWGRGQTLLGPLSIGSHGSYHQRLLWLWSKASHLPLHTVYALSLVHTTFRHVFSALCNLYPVPETNWGKQVKIWSLMPSFVPLYTFQGLHLLLGLAVSWKVT